jgi:hypothetical protein
MKKIYGFSILGFSILLISFQVSISSCKKATVIEKDTVVVTAKDTVFAMDVNNWTMFNQANNTLIGPGSTTYLNTSEGIKFFTQTARTGVRLQTKTEQSFAGKSIYYKWKAYGLGQFAAYVLSVKYDPTTPDSGNPPIQAQEFSTFSSANSFNGSTLIKDSVWYYSRVTPVVGTDSYTTVTSTDNYYNKGGTLVSTQTATVYTKHGYIAIRIGDSYASDSYVILGECKIAD